MIYDLAHEFRVLDVRRFAAALTYAELVEWARYLHARRQPDQQWIRDPARSAAMSAMLYG